MRKKYLSVKIRLLTLLVSKKSYYTAAQSIAKVIGAEKREDGYLEGNGYLVSWCVGHLVELASPESYDERYAKWRYEDLPILPKDWNYQVADATRKQFGILKKLMERDDVTGLVEATDAGREGELIFRLVYHQAKCKKPFERLWISSMEDQAISDGFSNLKDGKEYDDLYTAALCRERADWIVGMNATRLISTLYGQTLNVGRVMTPTLAMIVEREAEITCIRVAPRTVETLKVPVVHQPLRVTIHLPAKRAVALLQTARKLIHPAVVLQRRITVLWILMMMATMQFMRMVITTGTATGAMMTMLPV